MSGWAAWAGLPRHIVVDRGTHNRGVFSGYLSSQGITFSTAGVESAEMIGRTERHGHTLKQLCRKIIREGSYSGTDKIKLVVAEACQTKNGMFRKGGFSPQQWATGRNLRIPGGTMDEEERDLLAPFCLSASDGTHEFALRTKIREQARLNFVKLDTSARVSRALLRKAGPVPGQYQVGDLVCFRRRPKTGESGPQWSPPSKVVGRDRKVIWLTCNGIPIAVSENKRRTCSSSEILAFEFFFIVAMEAIL